MRYKVRITESQHKQIDILLKEACKVYGITRKELRGRWKPHPVAMARKTIMHLAAERIGLTLRQSVNLVGKRDHTSAIHAIRSSNDLLTYENDYSENFKKIVCKLNSHYA